MDRRVPNRPPTGLLRVNRAHSLARGLFDCRIFGPAGNYGLVDLNNPWLSYAFNPNGVIGGSWVNNPEPGLRRKFSGHTITNPWFTINNTSVNRYAVDFSVFSRFVPHTLGTGSNFPYVQAATGGTASLGPSFDDTFTHQTFFFLGNGNDATSYALPASFVFGAICNHGMSRGGTTGTYYANGKSIGSGTLSGTVNDGAPIEFSTFRAAGLELDVTHIVFYTWTRTLSAAEQLQLYLDPYCFLVPVFELVLKGPAVAASPIVFRKTLSQIGGRVGSRQPQGWAA